MHRCALCCEPTVPSPQIIDNDEPLDLSLNATAMSDRDVVLQSMSANKYYNPAAYSECDSLDVSVSSMSDMSDTSRITSDMDTAMEALEHGLLKLQASDNNTKRDAARVSMTSNLGAIAEMEGEGESEQELGGSPAAASDADTRRSAAVSCDDSKSVATSPKETTGEPVVPTPSATQPVTPVDTPTEHTLHTPASEDGIKAPQDKPHNTTSEIGIKATTSELALSAEIAPSSGIRPLFASSASQDAMQAGELLLPNYNGNRRSHRRSATTPASGASHPLEEISSSPLKTEPLKMTPAAAQVSKTDTACSPIDVNLQRGMCVCARIYVVVVCVCARARVGGGGGHCVDYYVRVCQFVCGFLLVFSACKPACMWFGA